jgi:hypothetical protein
MTDQVKLKCTFGTETVLSPVLDLYTCNLIYPKSYPPDIILNLNDPGVISYNINDYCSLQETKTKCSWDTV